MERPNVLLAKAAARLNADGHSALAQDVLRLSRKWTPGYERQLVDDSTVFLALQQHVQLIDEE